MSQGTRRVVAVLAVCLAVCLISALALHVIAPRERVARAVSEFLTSAAGTSLTVGSVKVESLKSIVLSDVSYSGDTDLPFSAQIEQVVLELEYPIADIILGQWTPLSSISRVELIQPTAVYSLPTGHDTPTEFDFESILRAIAANPDLRKLSVVVEVSNGSLIVSGLSPDSSDIRLTDASAQVTASGSARYAFELTATCPELANTPLAVGGFLDVDAFTYEVLVSALSIPMADTALLLENRVSGLSDLDVSSGAADIRLAVERTGADTSWRAEGMLTDAEVAHRGSGLGFRGTSCGFSLTPRNIGSSEANEQLGGAGSAYSCELTADAMEVEVSSLGGSTVLAFAEGSVSFVALPSEQDSVSAYGTATARSLSAGGVAMNDVACEFRYSDSSLNLTEVAGSLMGGELGGQLSVSLLDEGVSGDGHARIRGVMSSEVPFAGISDMIDAELDGTLSLTLNPDRGYGIVGRLSALSPRVAGLPFDDAALDFSCDNGSVSVDSLVVGLHGTRFVIKGDGAQSGQADVPSIGTKGDSDLPIPSPSS